MRTVLAVAVMAVLAGCATPMQIGDNRARGPVTGAAGGSSAQNVSGQLERCERPLGTVAVVEDTAQDWYLVLTSQYQLPATTPLLRLMIQQSNCFIVVDRGRAMNQMQGERALRESGELRGGSNFGRGQMVAADYALTPSIQFSQQTGGGALGAIAGAFSPVLGAIAGSMRRVDAATTLLLTDNRSGVQVAASEGVASKTDISLGAFGAGGGGAAGIGGWSRTPEGRIIAGAFMDAFNQMVMAARNYSAQTMGDRGLGTGGRMETDGARQAQAAGNAQMGLREGQQRLKDLGYYTGTVDGITGPRTQDAIRRFQSDNGISQTGTLTPPTQRALRGDNN